MEGLLTCSDKFISSLSPGLELVGFDYIMGTSAIQYNTVITIDATLTTIKSTQASFQMSFELATPVNYSSLEELDQARSSNPDSNYSNIRYSKNEIGNDRYTIFLLLFDISPIVRMNY